MAEPIQSLTSDNATHLLHCRHAIGNGGTYYKMRCHILKTMADGRLKLRVYGERYWRHTGDKVRVRYVESSRVSEI